MPSMTATAAALALCILPVAAQDCTFDYQIDPYTEYYGLNPDYTAYSSDDCKANCCADTTCDVWQYTYMPPVGGANCMWGVSTDYGDSGGVQYDGEQGRDDGGGGGNDPAEGGGGGKHHPKCIGPHCKDETAMYADLFVVAFGVAAVLYLVGGTYFGVQQGKSGIEALPNGAFWMNLGGLVKDGISFTASGGKPNELAKSMLADTPPGQPVVSMMGAEVDAEIGGASMAAAPGAARVKKKKKKRPTGAAGAAASPRSAAGSTGERKKKKRVPRSSSSASSVVSAASME